MLCPFFPLSTIHSLLVVVDPLPSSIYRWPNEPHSTPRHHGTRHDGAVVPCHLTYPLCSPSTTRRLFSRAMPTFPHFMLPRRHTTARREDGVRRRPGMEGRATAAEKERHTPTTTVRIFGHDSLFFQFKE